MRFAMVLALMIAVLPACKGEKGDKGDPASPAPAPAPASDIETYEGNVNSNDFNVSVLFNPGSDAISVYVGDSVVSTQLPVFLPALGFNAVYVASFNNVRIVNAGFVPASRYKIVVIKGISSSGLYNRLTLSD
jgi:hypothetical protein